MTSIIRKQRKYFIITKIKKMNFWTREEDQNLLEITKQQEFKNWKEIAKNFTNKSSIQCSSRYLKIQPGIKRGHWLQEEDNSILEHFNNFGSNWAKIAKLVGNRTSKQVRDRYVNYLDNSINKDKFTLREDVIIRKNYIKYGPKWAKIATLLEGRTAHLIKNRFYSYLKQRIHTYESNTKDRFRLKKNETHLNKFENLIIACTTEHEINVDCKKNELIVENVVSFDCLRSSQTSINDHLIGMCKLFDKCDDIIFSHQNNFNDFINNYIQTIKAQLFQHRNTKMN